MFCFETDDTEIIKEITKFIEVIEVLFINDAIISKATEYRKNIKLKIPDSIIAATAQVMGLTLVSADKSLIQKLKDVNQSSTSKNRIYCDINILRF